MLKISISALLLMLFSIVGLGISKGDFYVIEDNSQNQETDNIKIRFFRQPNIENQIQIKLPFLANDVYRVLQAPDNIYIGIKGKDNAGIFLGNGTQMTIDGINQLQLINNIINDDGVIYFSGLNQDNKFVIGFIKDGHKTLINTDGNISEIVRGHGPSKEGLIYILGRDNKYKKELFIIKKDQLIRLNTTGLDDIKFINGPYVVTKDGKLGKKSLFIVEQDTISQINLDQIKNIYKAYPGLDNTMFIVGKNNQGKETLLFINKKGVEKLGNKIKNIRIRHVYGPTQNGEIYFTKPRSYFFDLFAIKNNRITSKGEINPDSQIIFSPDGQIYYHTALGKLIRGPHRNVIKSISTWHLVDNIVR